MLDAFLEVAYEHEKRASDYHELVQNMTKLPKEELYLLAEGRTKLAFGCDSGDWLEKFQGTPLHEQALALEQQNLEIIITQEQKRLAEAEKYDAKRDECDELYKQQDSIRLKKRILDLELNKLKLQEVGGGGAEEVEEASPVKAASKQEDPSLAKHIGAGAGLVGGIGLAGSGASQVISSRVLRDPRVRRIAETLHGPEVVRRAAAPVTSRAGAMNIGRRTGKAALLGAALGTGMYGAQKLINKLPQDKEALASASVTSVQIDRMRKQAQLGAAIGAGLRGAGRFLGGGARAVRGAVQTGGVKKGLETAKMVGREGAVSAGRFAQKNPGAALALGGGALGAAGGLGYAAG